MTARAFAGGAKTAYPAATGSAQQDGPVYTFGGQRRVAIAQQGTTDLNPGSGIVEVTSGDGRVSQLTHYQYGTTLRTTGSFAGIVELWLGNIVADVAPNFSVRHNGSGKGAIVQARDAGDFSGVALNFSSSSRPKVEVEVSASLPNNTTMAIENGNTGGKIALATNSGGGLTDRLTVHNSGYVAIGPSSPNQLLGVSGPAAGISIQDTQGGGSSFELLSGSSNGATFSIYDRAQGSHRFKIGPDGNVVAAAADMEVATVGKGYVLKSPDGTRYRVKVANGGALSTEAA